ncbi:hypothetical protein [Campylobacter concisus]
MFLAKNDIEDVRSELLAKDAGIKLSVVERNGAFKAMKIYTFVAEI